MPGDRHLGGEGQIGLVDVASHDVGLHRRQRRLIFGPADQRARRPRPGAGGIGQDIGGIAGSFLREAAEPQQGWLVGAGDARQRLQLRL